METWRYGDSRDMKKRRSGDIDMQTWKWTWTWMWARTWRWTWGMDVNITRTWTNVNTNMCQTVVGWEDLCCYYSKMFVINQNSLKVESNWHVRYHSKKKQGNLEFRARNTANSVKLLFSEFHWILPILMPIQTVYRRYGVNISAEFRTDGITWILSDSGKKRLILRL